MGPSTGTVEPVLAGWLAGFVWACTDNLVNRFDDIAKAMVSTYLIII